MKVQEERGISGLITWMPDVCRARGKPKMKWRDDVIDGIRVIALNKSVPNKSPEWKQEGK